MLNKNKDMSFLDHLEELRWHLIRISIALVIITIIVFLSKHFVFHTILLSPTRQDFFTYKTLCEIGNFLKDGFLCIKKLPFILQSRKVSGQFSAHIIVSLIGGFIVSFPYIFWEIWSFIRPGLKEREKIVSRNATFLVSFLFFCGILFGYFFVSPISLYFLSNYQIDPSIRNEFDILSYLNTFLILVLSCGLVFEMPAIIYFLSITGVVSPEMMKKFRKQAVVIILFISAIITPPDIFSQLIVSMPILALYQISIFISHRVWKKKLAMD